MTEQCRLPCAPIKEALIDLRVALPQDAELGQLEAAHTLIKDRFPVKKAIYEGHFGIRFDFAAGENPTMAAEQARHGFRFESADGKQVVQFGMNGFTFSQLAPYVSWEDMRQSAKTLWCAYREAVSPDRVTRIATRFINEIRIPLPLQDFEEYLTEPPRIPQGLPQGLSSYLTRIVLPHPDINAIAIITQAMERAEQNVVPVVLDIDAFTNDTLDVDVDAERVWDVLDVLRDCKNDIFFKSVTKKAVELCQ